MISMVNPTKVIVRWDFAIKSKFFFIFKSLSSLGFAPKVNLAPKR